MLGGLKFKRDPSSWLGLVDGIYSVSMTLLIVSLPSTVKNFFDKSTGILYPNAGLDRILSITFSARVNFFILTLIVLAIFVITCDSWSFQRRQIQHCVSLDQLHCIYISIALFSAVLMPATLLVRMQHINIKGYLFEEMLLDWLIVFLLFLLYFFLFLCESRQYCYNVYNNSHRRKRINRFSILTLKRRISFGFCLAMSFLIAKVFFQAPPDISAIFIPAFATSILFENWSRLKVLRSRLVSACRHLSVSILN